MIGLDEEDMTMIEESSSRPRSIRQQMEQELDQRDKVAADKSTGKLVPTEDTYHPGRKGARGKI